MANKLAERLLNKTAGVAKVFTPGTPMATITSWLESARDDREKAAK